MLYVLHFSLDIWWYVVQIIQKWWTCLTFSKLIKIVIQNNTFPKIFSISFVKNDLILIFQTGTQNQNFFHSSACCCGLNIFSRFFSLNLLNIIVLKKQIETYCAREVKPSSSLTSSDCTIWGWNNYTASNIIFLVNSEPEFLLFQH